MKNNKTPEKKDYTWIIGDMKVFFTVYLTEEQAKEFFRHGMFVNFVSHV